MTTERPIFGIDEIPWRITILPEDRQKMTDSIIKEHKSPMASAAEILMEDGYMIEDLLIEEFEKKYVMSGVKPTDADELQVKKTTISAFLPYIMIGNVVIGVEKYIESGKASLYNSARMQERAEEKQNPENIATAALHDEVPYEELEKKLQIEKAELENAASLTLERQAEILKKEGPLKLAATIGYELLQIPKDSSIDEQVFKEGVEHALKRFENLYNAANALLPPTA